MCNRATEKSTHVFSTVIQSEVGILNKRLFVCGKEKNLTNGSDKFFSAQKGISMEL